MKVLLMGVGMQGKAALDDLVRSENVEHIVAADIDLEGLKAYAEARSYGEKVQYERLDAADPQSLGNLMGRGFDVAIDLLPVETIEVVAETAVRHGVHLVNTFYTSDRLRNLSAEAASRDVTLLPEFGLDPGIDLVLLGESVRAFDRVEVIRTYGAGIPEKGAADNPLKYKVSWTLEGALRSYHAPARIIRGGQLLQVDEKELFDPENVHTLELEGLGDLEAFPNGDALKLLAPLGLGPEGLRDLGRYTLRWPGHSAVWRKIVDLHLLDPEPVDLHGFAVDRVEYLVSALEPHLAYGPQERDLAIVRVEVEGRREGRKVRSVHQVIDRRDLHSGFLAMNRTVGFTASIGGQMIASGEIGSRGLLSPLRDVPYSAFVNQLETRGIEVTHSVEPLAA